MSAVDVSDTAPEGEMMTMGYWKIRGLASSLRMMFYYKQTSFKHVAYGEDGNVEWFGVDKPKIAAKNSLANLPYILDGETAITQSNSCLVYLGQKLGIDAPECMIYNHQVLDQAMDLRNDLMKIAYGPGGKKDFPEAARSYMTGAAMHFKKLEGFCKGPFMCGDKVQSGDFHVFEMCDQHAMMCFEFGIPFDFKASYPKLFALHAALKAEPTLQGYFHSDAYTKFSVNSPPYSNWTGEHYQEPFGPTTRTELKLAPKAKAARGPATQAKQSTEEKAVANAAKEAEKLRAKIIKEGGKKGVEIEGASDMGGLDFFCTTMELPEGNLDLLELSMLAMNAEPDPEAEDRKGCSGHIGKMIYSAGVEQLAIVAYVPDNEFNKSAEKVDVAAWMDDVCAKVGGEVVKKAFEVVSLIPDKKTGNIETGTLGKIRGKVVCAIAKSDPEKGKFALKDKDSAMAAAFAFLRSKGAFPEDNGDDSDEMIFGDDDNLDDY